MKAIPSLILATTALLMSSCQWNIGELIRASTAVHVGADTLHPVGGVYYVVPNGRGLHNTYAYAPEVTYRVQHRLTEWQAIGTPAHFAEDVTPTGRILLVQFRYPYPVIVDKLPEGAVKRPMKEVRQRRYHDHRLGYFPSERSSRGSVGAQILAAPFDFCIDPVLTLVSTVAGGPFYLPLMAAQDMLRHQQQQPVPYPEEPLIIPHEAQDGSPLPQPLPPSH